MSSLDDLFDAPAGPPPAPRPAAKPAAENRKEGRVRVNWPARVLRADGSFQNLRVYDLCETGAGFMAGSALPTNAVLTFAIAVPDFNGGHGHQVVTGTLKTAHMTIRGPDVHCGGPWITLGADAREILNKWIRKLRV
jgi:hypothetical protein